MPYTIEAVEICTAGMEWPASTGPATITLEHIADAVRAGNDDPHIQVPRGRLGHNSPLNDGQPRWDPFAAIGDAEPAFGRFVNLRAVNDGAVLIGDAVDVPDWITPGSYPNRSMECIWDVTTPGGKRYSMVVTAVAWLGPFSPAVQDLDDLVSLLAQGPPVAVAATQEANVPTELSVSVSAIRDRFNFDWTASDPVDGLSTYWWWARDVRVDPAEIIADDDEGGLWRIPFSTDGEDDVTFGEPVRVRETYVDVAPTAAVAEDRYHRVYVEAAGTPAAMAMNVMERQEQQVLASFTERPEKPQPTSNPAAASAGPDNEGAVPMDDTVRQALARQHGLDPASATEDDVNAAVLAASEQEETEEVDAPEAERELEPAAASRTVTIDRSQWEQTQREATAGAEARRVQLAAELDSEVDAAVRDTRITPASRDAWRQAIDPGESPDAAALARSTAERAALAALTPGRVPVVETEVADDVSVGDGPLPANLSILTPAERARRAA